MRKEIIEKQIFIENLPKHKNRIEWNKCIHLKVKGIYDNIEFEVEIKDYILKEQRLLISYNDEDFYIKTGSFTKCEFGRILNKITVNFKVEIGTCYKNSKRDIVIIDKEYREDKRRDKNGNISIAKLKYYKYHCNICGYEDWIEESHLLGKQNSGCSCCAKYGKKQAIEGVNDIPTTNPEMIVYFQGGYDEAKLYTYSSHKEIYPICPDCGQVKKGKMRIADIYKNHSIGCSCEDGQSYPEKFIFDVLEQLGLPFKMQLTKSTFKWCKNYKYDFYFELNGEYYTIETHGRQHYEEGSSFRRTLKEEQENDRLKKKLALNNGIKEKNYIVLDCRKSTLEWIKNSVLNSSICNIFDLSSIDWYRAEEFALSNLVKIACDYKRDNPELFTGDIAKLMKNSNSTVRKYLIYGNQLGWCVYNGHEEQLRSNKRNSQKSKILCSKIVICIEIEKLFLGTIECSKQIESEIGISISNSGISNSCRNETKVKGYTFKYIENLTSEEYIKYDIENKLKELHRRELVQAC